MFFKQQQEGQMAIINAITALANNGGKGPAPAQSQNWHQDNQKGKQKGGTKATKGKKANGGKPSVP